MTDSAQGSQRDKHAYLGPETETRADRCTQNYQRNPPLGLWLQDHHLSASQARLNTGRSRQLKLYLGSSAVCKNQPHKNSVLIKRGGHSSQPEPEPPIHRCSLISPKFLSTGEVREAQASICPGPPFCFTAGAEPALCSSSPQGRLDCLLQRFCLWQASPLSLSLCPYQCSTAGPGARPHSLNYRLRRTQCSLLCTDRDTFMARVQR